MRTLRALVALTPLLAGGPAAAQPESPEPLEPPPTFSYTTEAEPHALRAVLEVGGVLALGFAWYGATSRDTVRDWDVGYRWESFRAKITGEAFGPDTNRFGTNFVGHPLGGTGYYHAARSNRLSVPQSFAFAVAGSARWELFGEVREVISLNDTLVTPLGGLAVGEATFQLAAFFDRSAPTAVNRALGATFGPFKSLNDRFDDLELARTPHGFPAGEWHRFDLGAGVSLTRADRRAASGRNPWYPAARIELASELARVPGYTRAGRGTLWFEDANRSSLGLVTDVGASGVAALAFRAHVVLAGAYYRASTLDADGDRWGANGIVGFGTGFRYLLSDFERGRAGGIDRIAVIEPAGLFFEQRGALDGAELVTTVVAGPSFGGMTPLALYAYRGAVRRFPPVLVLHDYYFGLGGHGSASVALEAGAVEARAALGVQAHRAVGGPGEEPYTRIVDTRSDFSASLGYRVPGTVVKPQIFLERRSRHGRLGPARASRHELALGASLGAVF